MLKHNAKCNFFLTTALIVLISSISAWSIDSEYNSDAIKPFVSIGLDYRFIDIEEINTMISNDLGTYIDGSQVSGVLQDPNSSKYANFPDQDYSGNLTFGVEYDQLIVSLQGFMIPQQSIARPSALQKDTLIFKEVLDDGTPLEWSKELRYRDIDLSFYGGDFRLGYQLFPKDAFINIIPTIGYGVTFVNITFPSNYQYIPTKGGQTGIEEFSNLEVEDRPYTSIAQSLTSEIELRLRLAGSLHLSGYTGYRTVSFDRFRASRSGTSDNLGQVWMFGPPERSADMYYLGTKLTWLWRSKQEKYRVK
jgi:hypothetical protein